MTSSGTLAETPVFINGRFLAQRLTGVQRFAFETTAALIRHAERLGDAAPIVLAPGHAGAGNVFDARMVGKRTGQVWEQAELPRHAAGGILVNLGNTAPILAGRQIVVIHDAGVFRRPEAYSWQFRSWYKILQRLLVVRGTRIVTVSEFARRDIAACLGVRPETIAVVTEAGSHMRALTPDPDIVARSHLVPGRFVLAVGNLAAHKNLTALGETARRLAARGFSLAITGGLDKTVFGTAQAALPAPAIHVGRVSDSELASLYQAACCFVFPSTYEGFGLPALEAMEMGCPVVASGIPSLREVCDEAAVFCDPHDQGNIADTVCRIADDVAEGERLRRLGHIRCAEFDWDRTGAELAALIKA